MDSRNEMAEDLKVFEPDGVLMPLVKIVIEEFLKILTG